MSYFLLARSGPNTADLRIVPVIVIPGIMGSRLRLSAAGSRVWDVDDLALDLEPTTVAPFDLDDDGDDDLAVASRTSGYLEVVRNDALAFDAQAVLDLGTIAPLDLAVARWGDGGVHIAVLDASAPQVEVLV